MIYIFKKFLNQVNKKFYLLSPAVERVASLLFIVLLIIKAKKQVNMRLRGRQHTAFKNFLILRFNRTIFKTV
jgi:hypothetical protein